MDQQLFEVLENIRETRKMIKDVTQPRKSVSKPTVGKWTDSRFVRQYIGKFKRRGKNK